MESSKLWFKRLFFPGFNLGTRSRRIIRNYMLNEPDIRTLDLGCGNGFFTAMAVKRGGTALGVSFDPGQIDRCNEFKPYLGVDPAKLEFRVMNAVSILELEEKFDQILFLEVIEHIDRDTEVMTNIARLLKPGGVLQLTTPDIRWGLWTGSLDRFARGGHCRLGYTAYRLEQIVRAAGLDVSFQLKIGHLGNFLQPLQYCLIRLFGGGSIAEGIAFLLLYPIFLAVKWIPISDSMRIVQYIQARKPVSSPAEPPAT
jgi:SAM-dependent methyltransferase